MSDNKCLYIGRSELTDRDYLVYSNDCFYSFASEDFYTDINQDNLKGITRKYLTNTYGKCESQEHADFICELAENHDIEVVDKHSKQLAFFEFFIESNKLKLGFYNTEGARTLHEKLIRLPLPPKEKVMPEVKEQKPKITLFYKANPDEPFLSETSDIEIAKTEDLHIKIINHTNEHVQFIPKDNTLQIGGFKLLNADDTERKPVYTKEMHDRGEKPPVGSLVEVETYGNGVVKLHPDIHGLLCVLIAGEYYLVDKSALKPIQTIEDELVEDIAEYFDSGKRHCKALVDELLEKYNITPKGQSHG